MKLLVLSVLIIAGVLLFSGYAVNLKDYQVGDLGLGVATSAHKDDFEGMQINQIGGGLEEVIPAIETSDKAPLGWSLLMGNSQLHSINYYEDGDHLAIFHLNSLLRSGDVGMRMVQLSSPNINFQELLLYYLTLKDHGLKPDWIIIGCTYRAFQLTSLREDFQKQLDSLDLNEFELNDAVKTYYTDQHKVISANRNHPTETGTLQEKIENGITSQLEKHWEAYRYRGNVRSKLKVLPGMAFRSLFEKHSFYQGSQTTENLNMLFLEQLIDLCEKDGIKVLLYQPPHPQSSEPFQYNRRSYNACFRKLARIAEEKEHVFFESFETVVPLKLWGMNNSGRLDIFHFKEEGHRILAENIFQFLTLHNRDLYAVQ